MKIERFIGKYEFLSNFYSFKNGLTVEHFYQAEKTDDLAEKMRIMLAPTPGKAKRLGRKCVIEADFEERRPVIMLPLLRVKFEYSPLQEWLLATEGLELVEGNVWHDNYWGDCFCGRSECQERGLNMLGRLLMQIREELL